jgi:Ca2+-binding EF-hand superfamily protein
MADVRLMILPLLIQSAPPTSNPPETRAHAIAHAIDMHRRMDLNHDGVVTYREMKTAAMRMVIPPAALPDPDKGPDLPITVKLFHDADLNGDGQITQQEAIIGAERTFDRQDLNHDGLLSADEKAKALAEVIAATQKDLSHLPTADGDK